MNSIRHFFIDLRFALRQMQKAPGFTILAVLTLALGTGANTAMFTVVESVLLRPLPYSNPARLVFIGPQDRPGFGSTSWLNYLDIRNQSQTLAAVASYSEDVGVVQGLDGSVGVILPAVTPNAFPMLGTHPLLGRVFTEEEGQPGGAQVALLSEKLWRQSFHSDPAIVGKTIRINAKSRTVVGVMPSSFRFPEEMGHEVDGGLWLPMQPTPEMQADRGFNFDQVVGLLRPGVTLAQQRSELDAIGRRITEAQGTGHATIAFRSSPYAEMLTGSVRPVFVALVVALGLVLLIACANVANLLIARCLTRRHEFAVRAALGAGRWRLMQQLIAEGALLSIFGCLAGFGLAVWAIAGVHLLPADTIPRAEEIVVHWPVILTLAAIAFTTTILSSALPALLVSRTDPQTALLASSRGAGTRTIRRQLSAWLVSGEVALSALLLVATGLLFHTLWNLEHARLGFETSRITTFTAVPEDASGFSNMAVSKDSEHAPSSVATLVYKPALDRLRAMPGVEQAALDTSPPLSGIDLGTSFRILGEPNDQPHNYEARITAVSDGFEKVMGTPILRGRMITEDDTLNTPPVIVINDTLARKFFAGRDPLGHQINLGGADTGIVKPPTVVGVIADQIDKSVAQPPLPLLMIPYQQVPTTSLFYQALLKTVVNVLVKTRTDIAVAPVARSVFHDTAPGYALDNFQSMQQSVDQSNFSRSLGLYLIGGFAGLAILMVVAGLYGVLAQLVSARRREFGIRLALGASPRGILTMVLRQGLTFISAGIIVGIIAALFAGRLVRSFLYQVKPSDGWTYVAVVFTLALVGVAAALLPARRAASVEPMAALRDE